LSRKGNTVDIGGKEGGKQKQGKGEFVIPGWFRFRGSDPDNQPGEGKETPPAKKKKEYLGGKTLPQE